MKLWHNGILTADIEGTIDFFCAADGTPAEKWKILGEVDFSPENMVIGDGGKLRVAIGRVGGAVVELLQPMDETSYHAKQLKARGPGFHHNAYICEHNQDEVIDKLLEGGARIVWEFRNGGERAVYVEAADESAVLEIINCCPFMPEE